MGKKLKAIGKALSWIAKALGFLLKAIVFISKGAWKILSTLFGFAASAVSKAKETAKKPEGDATYEPLTELKAVNGSAKDFEKKLLESKSTIGIILGARGSGKSAFGMRMLENVHAKTNRGVCAIGFDASTLPDWIKCIKETGEIPNGSFVLVDEGGVLFSSRNAMSNANKLLSQLLLIARHKDLSVLFISQNSANLEVNALRQADYLVLKKPSLLQKDLERSIAQKIYDEASQGFKEFGTEKGLTYVYADEFKGFASNSLPSFWSEGASKAFKGFKT